MHPRLPLYTQTSPFSCGAAALVMALHGLRGTPTTRSHEFELWREATMVGIQGICQWGLTVPALRRGIPATVISEGEMTFPRSTPEAIELFGEEMWEVADFGQRENRVRADAARVRWERRAPTMADVESALAAGQVPVLLVDLAKLGSEEAPHWVVVTEAVAGTWVLHDPDPDGPGVHELPATEAWATGDASAYNAERTLVVLGP